VPGLIRSLEQRKCYFAGRDNFVTIELDGAPRGYEYRVFFKVRRKDACAVELIVQGAYLGDVEGRPRSERRKPIGFRVIVRNVLMKKSLVEAR
jgi:hypothetical protein